MLRTLARFCDLGLDGVEAFYVTHDREQTQLLANAAERHELLMTGSSDFHGPAHTCFSRFRAFDLHGHEPRLGSLADLPVSTAGGLWLTTINSGGGATCHQSRSASD